MDAYERLKYYVRCVDDERAARAITRRVLTHIRPKKTICCVLKCGDETIVAYPHLYVSDRILRLVDGEVHPSTPSDEYVASRRPKGATYTLDRVFFDGEEAPLTPELMDRFTCRHVAADDEMINRTRQEIERGEAQEAFEQRAREANAANLIASLFDDALSPST